MTARWAAGLLLRATVGLGLPLALYYGLRAGGVGVYLALLVSTLVSAAPSAVTLVRERRLDGLNAYFTAMMLGSVAVSLLSGSTEFLLAKGAVLTGVTGLWFIASVATSRPLAYQFAKPLAEGRLSWPADWEGLWQRSAQFRRMWRVSSVVWGVGGLLDAALRVVLAYTLPADSVPALTTALYLGTSAVLFAATNVYYARCGVFDRRSAMRVSVL